MKRIKLILGVLFLLQGLTLKSQSVTVDAPGVVEVGETFQVIYRVSAQPASFRDPDFGKLDVLVGPVTSTMSSTQIINGKRSDTFEVNYTYTLEANSEGRYVISPASAVIGGKSYSSKSVVIDVVKGDVSQKSNSQKGKTTVTDSDIFIRTTLNKTHVVKGEQIIATIKLYTKVGIGGFEDVRFPTFNGFWSQEVESPQSIEFTRENVDGKIYNAALIKKYVLVPQQTGNLTVDPAEMVTQVQVKSGSGGSGSMFDEFFESYQNVRKRLRSSAIKVVVSPLPGSAPASFTGGVGDFKYNVSLSKDSVAANEAVSVLVNISGTGNINLVEKPKLSLPSEFEQYDTKIADNSKASGAGISGAKQFEFPFIPRNPGTYTIPPIEFSYFDIRSKRYVTLKSKELTLRVGKDINGGVAPQNALSPGVNKQAVKNLGSDINYIKTGYNLSARGKFFIGSIKFYLLLLILGAAYYSGTLYIKKRIKMRGDVAGMKNRRANKVARVRLNKAENMLKQNLSAEFYEELHMALLGYSSDKLALNFADLTKERIKESLLGIGVSEELAQLYVDLLDACEYARYSPDGGGSGMSENYKKAVELISKLEA